MRQFLGFLILAVALQFTAHAADNPADNYAGWDRTHRAYHNVALYQTQVGIKMFYKAFERWPASWAEVVQSGVWQTPLRGPQGEVIDPDDQKLDFYWDLYYQADAEPPRLFYYSSVAGGSRMESIQLGATTTYRELFALVEESFPGSSVSAYLSDRERMVQFAILGGITRTLPLYKDINGLYPLSFADFVQSGLGPIGPTSLNPVTGKPFAGDGRANDILYKYIPGSKVENGSAAYKLVHTLEDGSLPRTGFSY